MKKLIKWYDIEYFFSGWKFADYFIFGCCMLAAFIVGIIAKGYYQ